MLMNLGAYTWVDPLKIGFYLCHGRKVLVIMFHRATLSFYIPLKGGCGPQKDWWFQVGTLISYWIVKLWGVWALVGVCAVGALIVWATNKIPEDQPPLL